MTTSAAPTSITRVHADSLRFSEMLLRKNLAAVSQAAAEARPGPDHNNVLWVFGHITYWRNQLVTMVGGRSAWDDQRAEAFKGMTRGPAAPTDGWRIEAISAVYDAATRELLRILDQGSDAAAAMSDALTKLTLHEAYHVGQVGTLRRLAGMPGAV